MKVIFSTFILSFILNLSIAYADFQSDFKVKLYGTHANTPRDFQITIRTSTGVIEGIYEVHKDALIKSKYFQSYFSRWYNSENPETKNTLLTEILLHDIDVLSFQRILYFLYNGELILDEEANLASLLNLQEYLQIEGIDQTILNYLSKTEYLSKLDNQDLADLLISLHQYNSKIVINNSQNQSNSFLSAKQIVIDYMIAHHKWTGRNFKKVLHFLKSEPELYAELQNSLKSESPRTLMLIAAAKKEGIAQKEVDQYIAKEFKSFQKKLKKALLKPLSAKDEFTFSITRQRYTYEFQTAEEIAKEIIKKLKPIYSSQFEIVPCRLGKFSAEIQVRIIN